MYRKDPKNNIELVRHILSLISEADIVLGHNAANFDNKRVNTEIIKHGLMPPPPYKTIDTLKVARQRFGFNFNSLKALAEFLGLPHKLETGGYKLWKDCGLGDMKAWAKMSRYCAGDTATLEALYMKFRPWAPNHPDMNARDGHIGCPVCRGVNLERRGSGVNAHGTYPRFQCRDCGKWAKGKAIRDQMHYR
jgi:hypothetical protein